MDINKYNEATQLAERIKALDKICKIEDIENFNLCFCGRGCAIFEVDRTLKNNVLKLVKSLKMELEEELKKI